MLVKFCLPHSTAGKVRSTKNENILVKSFALTVQHVEANKYIEVVSYLTVQQAVTPTRDLPAPQGRTITPDRARPFPNI